MKPIQPIDLSILRREPQVSAPATAPKRRPQRDGTWMVIAVIAIVLCSIAWVMIKRDGPTPSPIDDDGMYVLVVKPTDLSPLTNGQKEFLTSAKVADWVDANGGQYRAYPESQNTDNENQIWRDLRREADATHRVIVAKNRRLTRMTVPDGIDAGIAALERIR